MFSRITTTVFLKNILFMVFSIQIFKVHEIQYLTIFTDLTKGKCSCRYIRDNKNHSVGQTILFLPLVGLPGAHDLRYYF